MHHIPTDLSEASASVKVPVNFSKMNKLLWPLIRTQIWHRNFTITMVFQSRVGILTRRFKDLHVIELFISAFACLVKICQFSYISSKPGLGALNRLNQAWNPWVSIFCHHSFFLRDFRHFESAKNLVMDCSNHLSLSIL